ncbi:hypothetical protein ACFLTE_11325, partial [Bacteroidota bacterium]
MVTFLRIGVVSFDRNGWSVSPGFRWSVSPVFPPLPYLLKLTDILQEWERPSEINITGFSNEDFNIVID